MNKQTVQSIATDRISSNYSWTGFHLVRGKSFRPKEVLASIVEEKICETLRDQSTFVFRLKEFLISDLRKMYGPTQYSHEFYEMVKKIKNCHYFIEEEVTNLMQQLPESSLSKVA